MALGSLHGVSRGSCAARPTELRMGGTASVTYRPYMALVHAGLGRLATVAGAARTAAADLGGAAAYTARTFGTPAGIRGVAVELAWLTAHAAVYPLGLVREQLAETDGYRTDSLPPVRRGLVVTDIEAAGTPILLVHGIMDNRSVFTVFRRALRRRGFGSVHAVNYSILTGDVRTAAHELRTHVERLRERTGADKVHVVGHSLGGMIARYYVQRLGGHHAVQTARHARQPPRGHHHRLRCAHAARPPAAARLRADRRAGRAGARLQHAVPGGVEPDGPDGPAATQRPADPSRPGRRGAGAARRRSPVPARSTRARCTGSPRRWPAPTAPVTRPGGRAARLRAVPDTFREQSSPA